MTDSGDSPLAELRYYELRAEWLKFKGSLFDPNTGLPALPAVLEHVRRRIESGNALGLIYIDFGGDQLIEAVYGWEAYERLLREAAHILLDMRGRLLGAEDTIALLGIRDDEFVVFLDAAEAHDAGRLIGVRERVRAELVDRLRLAVEQDPGQLIAMNCGSCIVRMDPTMRIERTIYRAIDEAKAQCRNVRDESHPRRLKELRRILDTRDIEVRYQPIVRLSDGTVHGYEALSRGPLGDVFENAEVLFTFAEQTDLMKELERLCRIESFKGAAQLGDSTKLFLNTSARSFHTTELLSEHGIAAAARSGLRPENLVIEITERTAITEWHEVREVLKSLRRTGCYVAIDDVGSGYSSLKSVVELEPDYLKFEISLVRDIHRSPIKQNLLETLLTLADKIGALVVAEGVESEPEFQYLRSMGVMYGQGFYFAPPESFRRHSGAHVLPLVPPIDAVNRRAGA